MKCFIVLSFVAFATAVPLSTWGGVADHSLWGGVDDHSSWGVWNPMYQKQVAQQVAHQVTEHAIYDQIAHTNEAVKNLQWQLQQHPHYWTGHSTYGFQPYGIVNSQWSQYDIPSVGYDAMHHLGNDLVYQQHKLSGDVYDSVSQHLHDTVETGVEAQLAGHGVYGLESTKVDFQSKIQKLIDGNNKQEIEKQISHHHHWAQQLHEQEEFINHQKHKVEIQLAIAKNQGQLQHVAYLEQTHHQLEAQEYNLIKEQLAHHLANLQLQKALIHKEGEILQDIVAEHVHQPVYQGTHGLSQHIWSL